MAGYSIEGLEAGIERCRINISVLEEAIEKERRTIKEYRIMIDDLERAEKGKELAEANIHVEVDRDDGSE
jgi:uncharacterized OsmC-like protein